MQLTVPQISEPLKLWEKIEIVVGDGDSKGLYLARIEDFVDDGIVVSTPEFRTGNTLLRENCEVAVLVIKEDAVYQFYSRLSRIEASERPLYLLTLPDNIQRVQRRQYVRVDLFNQISYANLGSKNLENDFEWHDTVALNLSGGGMLIRSEENLAPPNLLLLKTEILDRLGFEQPVAAICRRSFWLENRHHSGVEFITNDNLSHYFYSDELDRLPQSIRRFDHVAQNRLVTFVFQQQIELRKKGFL
ncbi:MAG: flagellar brake domain-containing protein [Candidatus Zixiibacteriota bacterium]|nr:MAG: flagellar brake domain-containing protein [candidate division Zixibacteria bacterium]